MQTNAQEETEARSLPTLTRWAIVFADAVGAVLMREMIDFIGEAKPGAMLTLRLTRDGFTVQVTGPIVGRGRLPGTEVSGG